MDLQEKPFEAGARLLFKISRKRFYHGLKTINVEFNLILLPKDITKLHHSVIPFHPVMQVHYISYTP